MALTLTQGPYKVYFAPRSGNGFGAAVEITGIEDVDFATDTDSSDFSTIQGQKVSVITARKASVTFKFLDTSVANIKQLVPQAFLASNAAIDGQPTGTKVANTDGAYVLGAAVGGTTPVQGVITLKSASNNAADDINLMDGQATLSEFAIEDSVFKATIVVDSLATGPQFIKGRVTLPAAA